MLSLGSLDCDWHIKKVNLCVDGNKPINTIEPRTRSDTIALATGINRCRRDEDPSAQYGTIRPVASRDIPII